MCKINKINKIKKKYETIKPHATQILITASNYSKHMNQMIEHLIKIMLNNFFTKEKIENLIQNEEQRKQNNIKGHDNSIKRCIEESDKIKEKYNKIIGEYYNA